jgi:hypothetical protein
LSSRFVCFVVVVFADGSKKRKLTYDADWIVVEESPPPPPTVDADVGTAVERGEEANVVRPFTKTNFSVI